MSKPKAIEGRGGEIVLYRTKDGRTALDVRLDKETVWLTQRQMADLFQKDTDLQSHSQSHQPGEYMSAASKAGAHQKQT